MSPRIDRNDFQAAGRDNIPARTLQTTVASDDFFTDSVLDSSRIPTPSPSKKDANRASASRPRRALGTTRTLRAAWDATAGSAPPSSAGDNLRSLQDSLKPASVQGRGRSPAKPAKSQTISSPPRAGQTSLAIASPNSDASSPPRGLNDVYQRIADEERIAAQEGEIGEDHSTNSTMSQDSHIDDDRLRLNRIRSSQSPLTFRGANHNSLRPQTTEANKENHSNNTGLTEASGMSFLENMTDQVLAAKLTPHPRDRARDRARLDKAIQKSTPVAFTKAQVGLRHALTSENLQRSGRRESAGSVPSSSNGTLPHDEITPPPNVPRTWGSKGRVEKDWLRKIRDRNASPADITSGEAKQETSPMNRTAAAAEVPLPSVEDSLTPRPENSRNSTPAPIAKQSTQDWVRQWMLNDFTGNNLQVSDSPPVKVRGGNALDHVRDREIETLEKRAVTTSRLGEIRKKNSHSLLAGRSRSTDREAQEMEDDASSQKKETVSKMEEGEPIPNTPIVVFKGAPVNGVEDKENAKSRPLHDRKDSRDSLQRLAKAISESPRPSVTPEDWSLIKEEEIESAKPVIHKPGNPEDASRKAFTEVADDNSTSPIKRSRSVDAARTPVVTGAWTDTLLPDTIKTVKPRYAPPKYDQTPHVTGGWVDTPAPRGQRQSPAVAPVLMEKPLEQAATDPVKQDATAEEREGKTATKRPPNLPRALSNLLNKAKRKIGTAEQQHSPPTEEEEEEEANNDTLNLGDATIESLEELLTLDNADMTTLLRMGHDFEAREKADVDKEAGGISTEAELLERLGTKLERLKTNIHDARKGISKLEHQVSLPPPQHGDGGASAIKSSHGPFLASPCQACGCPHGCAALPGSVSWSSPDSNLYLTIPINQIPIPRLWHRRRADLRDGKHQGWWWWWRWWSGRLPRPTPLGWFTLAIWMWYISETVLCARYCHPEFAEYYTWPDRGQRQTRRERYGGDVEPRWGWVLWTLLRRLWNTTGPGPGSLVRLLLRVMVRCLAILAGWTTGFATEATTGNPSPAGGGGGGGVDPNVGVGVADAVDLNLDATMIHDDYL